MVACSSPPALYAPPGQETNDLFFLLLKLNLSENRSEGEIWKQVQEIFYLSLYGPQMKDNGSLKIILKDKRLYGMDEHWTLDNQPNVLEFLFWTSGEETGKQSLITHDWKIIPYETCWASQPPWSRLPAEPDYFLILKKKKSDCSQVGGRFGRVMQKGLLAADPSNGDLHTSCGEREASGVTEPKGHLSITQRKWLFL